MIAIAVFALVVYAGYLYVRSQLMAYYFQDAMQTKQSGGAQGYEAGWIKDQLVTAVKELHVPADAIITPVQKDGRLKCACSFPGHSTSGYTYSYDFDYTAKSTTFLTIK